MAGMTDALFPALPGDQTRAHAVQAFAAGLAEVLRLARVMTEAGRPVDLSGLERHVGLLCAKTLDLPPEQGAALRPLLTAVLADADALQAALEQRHPDWNSLGDVAR